MTLARPALAAARRALGWSQSAAARELAALARTRGGPSATAASLKSLLSRWENGHATPDVQYRELLAELYGRTATELGLAPGGVEERGSAARLRARLAAAGAVDQRLLRTWADQLEVARRLDDEVGAAGAAGVVRALDEELDRALGHLVDPMRRAMVGVLAAQIATLAGWQELDLGDPERAWACFVRARTTAVLAGHVGSADARPAGPVASLAGSAAEATAGLAAVLVDLGDADAALTLLDDAPAPAGGDARAWHEAARGAALAARGRAGEARRRFDAAERALAGPAPAGTGGSHVDRGASRLNAAGVRRWRARALATLGEPEATSVLEAALAAGIRSARERAASHAALAVAWGTAAAAGQPPAPTDRPTAHPGGGPPERTGASSTSSRAAHQARAARLLAERIGSVRAIALLDAPGSS